MAFALTYNSLLTSVQNEVQRQDATFLANIPMFMQLGQEDLSRELKILGLKQFTTGLLVKDSQLLAKPTPLWLNNSTFNIGVNGYPLQTDFNTRVQVLQRSYEFCRMYWPDPTQSAQPKYYADYNYDFILISPTPDAAYPYEFGWYGFPSSISEEQQTNFFTQYTPDALLYATLVHAAYFVEDERLQMWTAQRDKAIAAAQQEDMRRVWDAYSKRGG